VIDLAQFADESAIDPMYVDRTYYLAPDGGHGESDAFAVMGEGIKGKVGVGSSRSTAASTSSRSSRMSAAS
jgi:non-homologous end joining protein Ku